MFIKHRWVYLLCMVGMCVLMIWMGVENEVLASAPKSSVLTKNVVQSAEIVISSLDNMQYSPAVAYNWKHREYLVVWENVWPGGSHDIYAQRVSENGDLLSWFFVPDGTVSTANRLQPDVAYDPVEDRFLVVWVADVAGDLDVIGRFIPWSGPDPALKEFHISNFTNDEWKPKIAFARGQVPMEFMVVWMNAPSGADRWIGSSRVRADGNNPNPTNYVISQGVGDRDFPDIAYNRTNNTYLVVWDFDNSGNGTGFDIFGKRLQGDGSFIGTEFAIAGWPGDEEHPDVAACPESDQFLIAWQSWVSADTDVFIRFMAGDGTLGGLPFMDPTAGSEKEPSVACNMAGNQYLLTWQQQYSSLTGPYGISGKLIFPDESVGEEFGISGPFQGVTSDYQTQPAVAGGYHNYLTVWEQDRVGTTYQDIHGRLITPQAVFLPLLLR